MIKNEEKILFLVKFGKKEHLSSLLEKGELYFNSPKTFNDIKKINNETIFNSYNNTSFTFNLLC